MTPKLQRQRPDLESHLVRKPEPISTGAGDAEVPDTPRSPAPPASAPSPPATRTRATPPERTAPTPEVLM